MQTITLRQEKQNAQIQIGEYLSKVICQKKDLGLGIMLIMS